MFGKATALKLAETAAREAANAIGAAVQAHNDWTRADPYVAYVFHDTMRKTLPRIRWAARLHHRRWATRCWALMVADKRADELRRCMAHEDSRCRRG